MLNFVQFLFLLTSVSVYSTYSNTVTDDYYYDDKNIFPIEENITDIENVTDTIYSDFNQKQITDTGSPCPTEPVLVYIPVPVPVKIDVPVPVPVPVPFPQPVYYPALNTEYFRQLLI